MFLLILNIFNVYEDAVELTIKMGAKGLIFNGSPCNDKVYNEIAKLKILISRSHCLNE